jgi:hypothetical protein
MLQPNWFLVAGFMLFGILAHIVLWKTVAETNAQLPDSQKFCRWWWTFGKHLRLWTTHKRLCPMSHWRLYSVLSFLVPLLFMFLAAFSVLVPGH